MRVHTKIESPLGELTLVRDDAALVGTYFAKQWYRPAESTFGPRDDSGFDAVATQLGEYFAGTRHEFELPMHADGMPEQKALWAHVARIPYGQTVTYGELGRELGIMAKDVGSLMGRNPLCIVVPCHRVVGAKGALTGYAGGLDRKRALLELEGAIAAVPEQPALPIG